MDFETVVDVLAIYFFEVRLSLGIVHSRGFGFGVLLKVSLSTNLSVEVKSKGGFIILLDFLFIKKFIMMPGRFLNQWVNSFFTDSNLWLMPPMSPCD